MNDLAKKKEKALGMIDWINNTAIYYDMSTTATKMFDVYLNGNEETRDELVSALIFLYCLEKWKA